MNTKLAILGCGNIGSALAFGLLEYGKTKSENLTLTRRKVDELTQFKELGCRVTADNCEAVKASDVIICAVTPIKMKDLVNNWITKYNLNVKVNLCHYPYSTYEPFEFWGSNNKLLELIQKIER